MQAMNTDQQGYFPNSTGPHQAPNGYYQSNGIEQHYAVRNPNPYGSSHRMHQPYYNPQAPNGYGQQQPFYVSQPYLSPAPFLRGTDPQGLNPTHIRVVRPTNEAPNGAPNYMSSAVYQPYPNTNFQAPSNGYTQTFYRTSVPMSQIPTSQSQYSVANNQPQTQSSQQSSINQQYGSSSQSSQSQDKRTRKPLAIVDPVSQKALELETSTPPTHTSTTPTIDDNHQIDSVTDLTMTKSRSPSETNKTQKQAEFRQQFARLLDSNGQTDKNGNQSSNDDQIDVTSTNTRKEPGLSRSSTQPQPGHPGIRTRSVTDDKSSIQINQDDINDNKQDPNNVQQQLETVSNNSESMSDNEIQSPEETASENINATTKSEPVSSLTTTESVECSTSTPSSTDTESESINPEKTPSMSKRYRYSKQELLNKRSNPVSQAIPHGLTYIPEVVDSSVKQKPVEKNKIDANVKFLRDITAILNKLTKQTYDKLLQKLNELELDRYERLAGMIDIIFSKAVEEPKFCSMYADLCKAFQKKQVTVPSEDGQTVTHYFRQILLTRCQKGFENDYRADIDYDKRKAEVDAITDEKIRKEKAEDLEEALFKAKRRNFGNILFIGELFKLGMLTDTIMYQCMELLLQDKADEENLECLCRLLRTIGKELEAKSSDKSAATRKTLEKNYGELDTIAAHRNTSARTRFMIQDLMDLRKANWVARIAEAKPVTIDEIHQQERIRREQQEHDQERDRQQRREQQHRGGGGNNPQQYTGSRGSRGSGMRQQPNRADEERTDKRFSVNSVRQYQSGDKRNQGPPLNLAPQGAWPKVSGTDKKNEDDRSNANRTGKPPANSGQQFRPKTVTSPGTPGYAVQRQPSRELARGNSVRDRENAIASLRKTTSGSGATTPNNTPIENSREGSRTASPESSVNERTSNADSTVPLNKTSSPPSTTIIDTNLSNTPFDEEKTQTRMHALIEEYTGNYSDNNDRPVTEAIEDLSGFCTSNINQQALVVRELFTNVLEAKPRARKAIGHFLDVALHKDVISTEGFLSGFKMVIEVVPDYAVDIPLIWQYIGEILGAFIGAPLSNMLLLKPVLQLIPDEKSEQLFQYIIRYATEFSSKSHIQTLWQSADLSLNDLFKSDSMNSAFINEYDWLSEVTTTTTSIKGNSPCADPQLVKLFKSVNDQGATVTEAEIIEYIHKNMNPEEKFYIRNIVLSYLEACLVNRGKQKKIQEDITKARMTILNAIIEHRPEAELQAVYAIQNFVSKLEHPQKMAQLLFDIFYDDECVSEETFYEWRKHPDQSETEGHAVVVISTTDFFTWLQQAEDGEEEQT